MKNLSNLLAVLLFVVMLGVLAGCGCGTTDTPPTNDMVNDTNHQNTNDTTVETRPDGIIQDTTPNTIIDGEPNYGTNNNTTNPDIVNPTTDYYNTVSDNNVTEPNGNVTNNTHNRVGNVVDDAGNIVGDVVDDAGRAISDIGNGVRNMTNDMTR